MRSQPRPTLDQLATEPAKAATLPLETVEALLSQCSVAQGALVARLLTARDQVNSPTGVSIDQPRLLTIPEAAQLLGVAKGYAYELARRGAIPTIRFGKYVRVCLTDLWEWVARHQEKGLDLGLCVTHSSSRERHGGSTASQSPGAHPSSTGRAARRDRQQRGPVGAGRAGHPGVRRPAAPAASEDGTEGQA